MSTRPTDRGAGIVARLPAALRTRRDVLDGRSRWADAAVVGQGTASAVLTVAAPVGALLWAVGDVDELERLVPDALVGHGPGLRWVTVPRAVTLPAEALAAAGLVRTSSWDRLTSDVAPAPQPGERDVVRLDPARDAAVIDACLDVANPGTQGRPGAPDDAAWWGVRGADRALTGVIGVAARPGSTAASAHLHALGVLPVARGRGLGRALTAAATRHALAHGAPWVSLGMYADNTHARRVYTALGFGVDVENAGYGPPGVTHPHG